MNRRQKNRATHRKGPVPRLLKAAPETAMTVGYGRVSTEEQRLDMQLAALKEAGCQKIYVEHVSAKSSKRPQFNAMLKFLEGGDTLVLYAFNRLSRNLKQLLGLVDEFKAQGIRLKSTSEPHIDPYTTAGRLLISVVGAVDENEVGRVRDRTVDGMAEAKRRGSKIGRERIVTPAVERKMRAMRKRKVPVPRIAKHFGVRPNTVYANTGKKKVKG